jgi:hypothetical protein
MKKKTRVSLQPSEGLVFQVAGNIYAAHLAAGRVAEGQEEQWMARALTEATRLAQLAEGAIQSDTELD